MTKIYFDNEQMSKGEMADRIREQADFTKAVSREEARTGITTTDENDLNFFKEG
jgi:hypothetical protein